MASDPLIPLITTVPSTGHDDALAFIARQRRRILAGEGYSFAIADRGTGEAVGQIGLWLRDIGHGSADIGYWVAPKFRRCGYPTRALAVMTEWAIGSGTIDRLQIVVEPRNEGSWRAAGTCGYQREGLLRAWQMVGDIRRDMFIYSFIAE